MSEKKKSSNLKSITFIYDLLLIGKIAPLHQDFDKNNYLIQNPKVLDNTFRTCSHYRILETPSQAILKMATPDQATLPAITTTPLEGTLDKHLPTTQVRILSLSRRRKSPN